MYKEIDMDKFNEAVEKERNKSDKEIVKSLQKIGVLDKEGNLTPQYEGLPIKQSNE